MNNSLTPTEKSWVETQMIEAEKKWLKMQQDVLDEMFNGRYLEWLTQYENGKSN